MRWFVPILPCALALLSPGLSAGAEIVDLAVENGASRLYRASGVGEGLPTQPTDGPIFVEARDGRHYRLDWRSDGAALVAADPSAIRQERPADILPDGDVTHGQNDVATAWLAARQRAIATASWVTQSRRRDCMCGPATGPS